MLMRGNCILMHHLPCTSHSGRPGTHKQDPKHSAPWLLDLCVVAAYSFTTQLNTSPSGRSDTHTSEPGLSVPGHLSLKVGASLLASDWRLTSSSRAAASYESPTLTSKSLTLGYWAFLSRGRSLTPRMCTITYPLLNHCNTNI